MPTKTLARSRTQTGVAPDAPAKTLLARQAREPRPFAELAKAVPNMTPREIAVALAAAILDVAPQANLTKERHDASALGLLTAKDAWDNLVLPLRIDAGQLVCATTEETLVNAVELLAAHVAMPFRIVIADIRPLEQFIAERYRYEGVDI